MADEHLYFAVLFNRWALDQGWAALRRDFFGAIPAPLRWVVPPLIRRSVLTALKGQGMGRHSEAEVADRAAADIAALKALIGDDAFLFGARPSSADAAAAPMLAAMADGPVETRMRDMVRADAAIMAWLERVRAAIYPPDLSPHA